MEHDREDYFGNLNDLGILTEGKDAPQIDYSFRTNNVRGHFKNLESAVINYIDRADAVFGCVAWMSNYKILDALAKKSASIVVQKEDLWRPDFEDHFNDPSDRKQTLLNKYMKIGCDFSRYEMIGDYQGMSSHCDSGINGVRCVGYYNREEKPSSPRMHHKFIVFAKSVCKGDPGSKEMFDRLIERGVSPRCFEHLDEVDHYRDDEKSRVPVPYAVWTGSFNFSQNANNSFENALYIQNPDIAWAYFCEYAQILALSEPLEWDLDWSAPEWRIGS